MNERLLGKLKLLSNAMVTVKKIDRSEESSVSLKPVQRTRGTRGRNERSKKQKLKEQLKDF